MVGLLQLPPAPRSPRWADSLRAALGKERACQRVTEVLRPYSYPCVRNGPLVLVGAPRFELGTPCTPCKCATRLRHAPTRLFLFGKDPRYWLGICRALKT